MSPNSRPIRRRFRGSAGAGVIEVAIIIPVVLMIIFGTVSIGLLMYRVAALQQALNAAGAFLTVHPELSNVLYDVDPAVKVNARQALENYALSQATFAGMTGVSTERLVPCRIDPTILQCTIAVLLPGEHAIFTTPEGETSQFNHPLDTTPTGALMTVVFVARIKAVGIGGFSLYRHVVSSHIAPLPLPTPTPP
jgi:Flp pilus assembly protein TadG